MNRNHNLPVAEIIECNVMGQQTIMEIEGRLKFLRIGDKLYTQPSQVAQPEQLEGDAKDAERLTILQSRLHQMQVVQDRLLKILTGIHALLHPPMFAHEGKTYKFVNPDANETLDELSKRIKAIPDEIDAAIASQKATQ